MHNPPPASVDAIGDHSHAVEGESELRGQVGFQPGTDGNDTLPVDIEMAAGEVKALAAMHGGNVGDAGQSGHDVGDPAGGPGMCMQHVDLPVQDQFPYGPDIAHAVQIAAVVQGYRVKREFTGHVEAVGGEQAVMSVAGLMTGERQGIDLGPGQLAL